jgi:flagellar protein FlaJ
MLAVKLTKRDRNIVYSLSALIAVAVVMSATFIWPGFNSHPDYDTFVVVAMIVGLFPPSIMDLLDRRWRSSVNGKLPELIREIAEAQKTGMALPRAIEHASRLNYGPLSKELRKTVSLQTWGWTYPEALEDLAERIGTALAYRTVAMLNEVGRSGGRLYEILDNVYSHLREIKDLESDRRRQMQPYVMIIFASLGVFLFVVYVLFVTFFAQIRRLIASNVPFLSGINPDVYYIWFFHMAVIEAVISGFVAGKISEGSVSAGLKYVLILLIVSLLFFLVLVGPQ